MKKCPFFAEEIQIEAIKCKHCGEFLKRKPKEAWYFRTSILVIAILSVGPLALPLLWYNPRHSRQSKIIVSLIVCVLSYFLMLALNNALQVLDEYYQILR